MRGRRSRQGGPTPASWRHLRSALHRLPRPGRPQLGAAHSLTPGVPAAPTALPDSAPGEARELPTASAAGRPRSPQLPPQLPSCSAVPSRAQAGPLHLTEPPRLTARKWGAQAVTLTLGRVGSGQLKLACRLRGRSDPARLHPCLVQEDLPASSRPRSPQPSSEPRPPACPSVPRDCSHLFNTALES